MVGIWVRGSGECRFERADGDGGGSEMGAAMAGATSRVVGAEGMRGGRTSESRERRRDGGGSGSTLGRGEEGAGGGEAKQRDGAEEGPPVGAQGNGSAGRPLAGRTTG
jgi:hypothetical protein